MGVGSRGCWRAGAQALRHRKVGGLYLTSDEGGCGEIWFLEDGMGRGAGFPGLPDI